MLDLQWRLQALDPEASESLRVIAFFDALTESQAGVEAILRSAASLTAAPVMLFEPERGRGVLAEPGGRLSRGDMLPDEAWPGLVWDAASRRGAFVARPEGQRNVNDALVLERLGMALRIADERARRAGGKLALEVLLDAGASQDERDEAAIRLRLTPQGRYFMIATPFSPTTGGAASGARRAVLFTAAGMLRAELVSAETEAAPASGIPSGQEPLTVRGVGAAEAPRLVHRSWAGAVAALKLTSAHHPLVRAEDVGDALALEHVPADSTDQLSLAEALARHAWAADTVEALSATGSAREAARELGVHHSTLQKRAEELKGMLGYDPATGAGAFRLRVAFIAWRLRTRRF